MRQAILTVIIFSMCASLIGAFLLPAVRVYCVLVFIMWAFVLGLDVTSSPRSR